VDLVTVGMMVLMPRVGTGVHFIHGLGTLRCDGQATVAAKNITPAKYMQQPTSALVILSLI
jgi:hypothetical protein